MCKCVTVGELIEALSKVRNKDACVCTRVWGLADASVVHVEDETCTDETGTGEIGNVFLYPDPDSDQGQVAVEDQDRPPNWPWTAK